MHRRDIIRYGAAAGLLALVTTITTAKLSGDQYANGIQATRTSLQRLQDNIAAILEPNEIELGQQDLSIDYLLEQTDSKSAKLAVITRPPSRVMMFIHLLPKTNYPYASLSQAAQIRADAKGLTDYQHRMFSALQPVLEYNPRAEFADKTLNDEEIKLRISNARSGLQQSQERLRKVRARQGDTTAPALLEVIKSLSSRLETFATKRDYDSWAKDVEQAQRAIITNRQTMWSTEIHKIYTQISTINQNLATIESALRG